MLLIHNMDWGVGREELILVARATQPLQPRQENSEAGVQDERHKRHREVDRFKVIVRNSEGREGGRDHSSQGELTIERQTEKERKRELEVRRSDVCDHGIRLEAI